MHISATLDHRSLLLYYKSSILTEQRIPIHIPTIAQLLKERTWESICDSSNFNWLSGFTVRFGDLGSPSTLLDLLPTWKKSASGWACKVGLISTRNLLGSELLLLVRNSHCNGWWRHIWSFTSHITPCCIEFRLLEVCMGMGVIPASPCQCDWLRRVVLLFLSRMITEGCKWEC